MALNEVDEDIYVILNERDLILGETRPTGAQITVINISAIIMPEKLVIIAELRTPTLTFNHSINH